MSELTFFNLIFFKTFWSLNDIFLTLFASGHFILLHLLTCIRKLFRKVKAISHFCLFQNCKIAFQWPRCVCVFVWKCVCTLVTMYVSHVYINVLCCVQSHKMASIKKYWSLLPRKNYLTLPSLQRYFSYNANLEWLHVYIGSVELLASQLQVYKRSNRMYLTCDRIHLAHKEKRERERKPCWPE